MSKEMSDEEKKLAIERLADEFEEHFLSVECSTCHAAIGEPCRLEGGKYHIDRGIGDYKETIQ